MARRPTPPPPAKPRTVSLLVSRAQARTQLETQVSAAEQIGQAIRTGARDSLEQLEGWSRYAEEILARMVDSDEWQREFRYAHAAQVLIEGEERDPSRLSRELADRLRPLKHFLSILDVVPEPVSNAHRTVFTAGVVDGPTTDGKTVFVVHGHDLAARDSVELFIRRIGLNPIILSERPNRGDTVIEKIEREGVCDFAVVLLTPDDRGGPKTSDPSTYRDRARQNVLLELGYFIGKIGRERVCALYKGEVEIPSDYSGVVWVRFDDAGAWRRELGKELDAAKLPVDLSRA